MKSITIHKVDDPIIELIKQRATEEGLSINQVVKKLLEEALGVKPPVPDRHEADFKCFLGRWSENDKDAFENAVQDLNQVIEGDWQ